MTETELTKEDIEQLRGRNWTKVFARESHSDSRGPLYDFVRVDFENGTIKIKASMVEKDGYDHYGVLTRYQGPKFPVNHEVLVGLALKDAELYRDKRDLEGKYISGAVFRFGSRSIGIFSEDFSVLMRLIDGDREIDEFLASSSLSVY